MILTSNSKEIRAVYTDETIRVYQAYNKTIAEEAVKNGTFGAHFSMDRMTWIKPSFLWMMYRCGWAQKENQEHVLAIDIKRTGFDKAVDSAVISTFSEDLGITKDEWQKRVKESDVRVQWDPEKDINGNNLSYRSLQLGLRGDAVKEYVHDWIVKVNGNNLSYRSLQLGLRGDAVKEYVHDWIVKVTDITDYVNELNALRINNEDISDRLPKEMVYKIGR